MYLLKTKPPSPLAVKLTLLKGQLCIPSWEPPISEFCNQWAIVTQTTAFSQTFCKLPSYGTSTNFHERLAFRALSPHRATLPQKDEGWVISLADQSRQVNLTRLRTWIHIRSCYSSCGLSLKASCCHKRNAHLSLSDFRCTPHSASFLPILKTPT